MPLAFSCSAATSAACHPPPEDVDAALLPVMWGAVRAEDGDGVVAHCCFTSKEVAQPISGQIYAGDQHVAITR